MSNKVETPAQVSTSSEVWETTKTVAMTVGTAVGMTMVTAFAAGVGYIGAIALGQWTGILPKKA